MLHQTGWPGWGHGCRRLAAQWCSAEMDDAVDVCGLRWWKTPRLASSSSRRPHFSSCSLLHKLAAAPRHAGVGESTRGCRLEADKIREESRLSNPRWLFSSPHCFVASPRGFNGREEEGCGASRALDRWTTLSLHVLHRGTSYPSTMCKSKQYVEDVIIFALSSSILDSRAFF